MKQPLFTNMTMLNTNQEEVKNFLLNPTNILKWDAEIGTITPTHQSYQITRKQKAVNTQEILTIIDNANEIIYQVKGDRLSYQVVFTINYLGKQSELSQKLLIAEDSHNLLPLKLLKPIVKHAFSVNLANISQILEKIA